MEQSQAGTDTPYGSQFFAYTDRKAIQSAEVIIPIVKDLLGAKSVADFGCGHGGWLAVWKQAGVENLCGVDGDYVNQEKLMIDREQFISHDLCNPIDLETKFDLVQSLEVGEHLPASVARGFVKTLTSHSNVVLFSAAPPGQGGVQHINEQPYTYWQKLFNAFGFEMLDIVRPQIQHSLQVAPWYRFNTFVYVHQSKLETLPEDLRARRIARGQPVPDMAPLVYRIRRWMIRPLPVKLVDRISMTKRRWRCGPAG